MPNTAFDELPEDGPDYDFFDDDDNGWCGDCGDCEHCWDEQMDNCGMLADGSCNFAGTEYCDWDCRMSELDDLDDEIAADATADFSAEYLNNTEAFDV